MAVYSCSNLLGCKTLSDWARLKSEWPYLFGGGRGGTKPGIDIDIGARRKNQIIYFALQGAAVFHVCAARYKQQYMLLQGGPELRVLLDFAACGTALEQSGWMDLRAVPAGAGKERLAFSDIPLRDKERLLALAIPHSDFIVTTEKEMKSLRTYYNIL